MQRNLPALVNHPFDLLVVGAGIQGAWIAWDATLRGLAVAVVDQGDFGAATSANSLRIVHGGLRYLARGDFPRMLESIQERRTLLRIAPGLVAPLPVLIPTYGGSAMQGKLAYRIALMANDAMCWQRNRELQRQTRLPAGRIVSRNECLELFPWFPQKGLTGGALWYDAALRHPERLTLSLVCSASRRGAVPGNYVRVDRLLVEEGQVRGAAATDLIAGEAFQIRAKTIVIAAGPWTSGLISRTLGDGDRDPGTTHALALNVVVRGEVARLGIGVRAPLQNEIGGMNRFLFINPQPGSTLLGTWYGIARSAEVGATRERGARELLDSLNTACPGLQLSRADVVHTQWGWLPRKYGRESGRLLGLADRAVIVNHGRRHGPSNLFSVEGVKFTTARAVAQRVVDQVAKDFGRSEVPCRTAVTQIEGVTTDLSATEPASKAVHRAVHQEMAVKLADIVRRLPTGSVTSSPSRPLLEELARLAAGELGWDARQQQLEVEEVWRESQLPSRAMEPVG
jgi:glycerol-3-phosphate dehydrogenase